MERPREPRYLLDVNVLIALTNPDHVHYWVVRGWFYSEEPDWALCAFTEAGFLRNATAPRPGQISMEKAGSILGELARHPGYGYQAITTDWQTLSAPFAKRLYGTKQVTDAYLLGLAVREDLVLCTMDKGVVHLAGKEYGGHVLLLEG